MRKSPKSHDVVICVATPAPGTRRGNMVEALLEQLIKLPDMERKKICMRSAGETDEPSRSERDIPPNIPVGGTAVPIGRAEGMAFTSRMAGAMSTAKVVVCLLFQDFVSSNTCCNEWNAVNSSGRIAVNLVPTDHLSPRDERAASRKGTVSNDEGAQRHKLRTAEIDARRPTINRTNGKFIMYLGGGGQSVDFDRFGAKGVAENIWQRVQVRAVEAGEMMERQGRVLRNDTAVEEPDALPCPVMPRTVLVGRLPIGSPFRKRPNPCQR